ncbi:MAG: C25 family cysteine peptidase, partial [Candidatus Eiseniibacteriota bacterium]
MKLELHDGATEARLRGGQAEVRAGYPDLPWISERIELPDGQRIARIDVLSIDSAPLAAGVRMASAIRPQPASLAMERTAPDSALSAKTEFQPEAPAQLALQGYEDGIGVALVRVSPVRWNAASGALEMVTRLRVRLVLETDPGTPVRRERTDLPWIKPRGEAVSRAAVTGAGAAPAVISRSGGAQPFQATQLPSLLGSPVEYLIVTNDAMAAQMQRLADWKTETGMPAAVRTISFIRANYPSATDDADRIRQFIRDAYQRWGTKYVLLGGDTDVLPTRYAYTLYYYGGSTIATDLYYQCLDGNWNSNGDNLYGQGYWDPTLTGDSADLMPELWVGRAPVNTVAMAQQFVDRTLQYEKTPVGDYENSILFFAEVLFPQDWTPGTVTYLDGAQLVENLLPYLDPNPALHYGRLYENYTDPRWRPGALQELKSVVLDSLDRGYNIGVHIGHGFRNVMSCGNDNMTNGDALALTNGLRYSNMYAIDCTSNSIDFPCLGEALLHASGGGAVTNIGSTRVDFPTTGQYFQQEYFRVLFQDSVTTIGEAFAKQKYPFIGSAFGDNVNRWTIMTLLLLGDPSLRIWTGRPRTMTVTPPASVAASDSQVTVHVTVGGQPLYHACVTAFRSGIDFSSDSTDGAGNVTLPFRPDTVGSFTLAVTGYDCRPVELQIPVVAGLARPVLAAQAAVLDDGTGAGTSGDKNGLLDAGETVDIRVPLRNNGTAAAPAASAVLSTTDGMVNIVNASVSYGAIAAGALSSPAGAFRISLSATVPDQREVPFTLSILDGAGRHSTQKFQLVVHGPDLASYSHSVVDLGGNADGRPDPGETVQEFIKLRNIGTGTARAVSLVLRRLDALSVVTDSTSSFGDLAPGQEKQGDAVVLVPSSSGAQFQLRVSDQYGLVATQPLDLSYPSSPVSLQATGSGTNIQVIWAPNPESDLQGYNVYQATNPAGPFTKVSVTPSDRTSYY